jgi:hypothetical protein
MFELSQRQIRVLNTSSSSRLSSTSEHASKRGDRSNAPAGPPVSALSTRLGGTLPWVQCKPLQAQADKARIACLSTGALMQLGEDSG